jgi:hypothetical protein
MIDRVKAIAGDWFSGWRDLTVLNCSSWTPAQIRRAFSTSGESLWSQGINQSGVICPNLRNALPVFRIALVH